MLYQWSKYKADTEKATKVIMITSTNDTMLRSLSFIPFLFWWMQTSIRLQAVSTSTPSPVKRGLQFTNASNGREREEKQKENKERNSMLDIKSK